MKNLKWYYLSIGLLVLVALIFYGSKMIKNNTTQLTSVEVRDYKGEKLSSIADFKENSIKGPQYIDINTYALTVTGLVNNEKKYSYDEAIKNYENYSKVVTLYCVEGWNVKILWEGILIKDLLNDAGINPKTNTVIFHSYDGYTTSLPLDFVINNDILLAYKMNGITIPPERGFPFMVVAENKYGYKWAKWVTSIELSDNKDYKGYWENAGFSSDADIHSDTFLEPKS